MRKILGGSQGSTDQSSTIAHCKFGYDNTRAWFGRDENRNRVSRIQCALAGGKAHGLWRNKKRGITLAVPK